jgi:hypothetical protein
VSPATHPPGRGMMSEPPGGPALTGGPRPASVPAPAGLTG